MKPVPPLTEAGLFLLHDPDWRRKVRLGGWLLLLPVFGWPIILGYRKDLIGHLFRGTEPPLPPWRGRVGHHLIEGIKAVAVIYAQLAPVFVAFGVMLASRGFRPDARSAWAALFFLMVPIVSTLAFPSAVAVAACPGDPQWISLGEAAGLLAAYTAITFVIPAGFLQVSRTGRYPAAFRWDRSLPFLFRHFKAYILAWYRSILMSLTGHFAVPFSPWGVVWCYLGIIYLFNQVLVDDLARAGKPPVESWFERMKGPGAIELAATKRSWLFRVVHPVGMGRPTWVVGIGPVTVPLPRLAETWLMIPSVEPISPAEGPQRALSSGLPPE